jgi:hypothetical protein
LWLLKQVSIIFFRELVIRISEAAHEPFNSKIYIQVAKAAFLLGKTATQVNSAELVWDFFHQQNQRVASPKI